MARNSGRDKNIMNLSRMKSAENKKVKTYFILEIRHIRIKLLDNEVKIVSIHPNLLQRPRHIFESILAQVKGRR